MYKRIKHLSAIGLACVILLFQACASSPDYITRNLDGNLITYRVTNGDEHAIYRIDKDGATTVYDPGDPMAQQLIMRSNKSEQAATKKNTAATAKTEKKSKRDQQLESRYEKAPKRGNDDPVYVAMFPTELGPRIAATEKHKGAVFESIRRGFEDDAVISLIDQDEVTRFTREWDQHNKGSKRKIKGLNEHVRVYTKIHLEDGPSLKSSSGEYGVGTYVHLSARIQSLYPKKEYSVKSSADLYQNVQAIQELTKKIKDVIKNQIGPTLPKR